MTELPRITDPNGILKRQIPVNWLAADGVPMSVAFRPTPKDERLLSTDQPDVTPREAFEGYEKRTGIRPSSTWGFSVGSALSAHECLPDEVKATGRLEVIADGGTAGLHAGHASVAFPMYEGASNTATRKHDERIARVLKEEALKHGRLHPTSS